MMMMMMILQLFDKVPPSLRPDQVSVRRWWYDTVRDGLLTDGGGKLQRLIDVW